MRKSNFGKIDEPRENLRSKTISVNLLNFKYLSRSPSQESGTRSLCVAYVIDS